MVALAALGMMLLGTLQGCGSSFSNTMLSVDSTWCTDAAVSDCLALAAASPGGSVAMICADVQNALDCIKNSNCCDYTYMNANGVSQTGYAAAEALQASSSSACTVSHQCPVSSPTSPTSPTDSSSSTCTRSVALECTTMMVTNSDSADDMCNALQLGADCIGDKGCCSYMQDGLVMHEFLQQAAQRMEQETGRSCGFRDAC